MANPTDLKYTAEHEWVLVDGSVATVGITAYAAEKLKEARYAFSDQEVKPYFTETKVLSGLFRIIETLFEVAIRLDSAPVWHPSVRFYRIDRPGTGDVRVVADTGVHALGWTRQQAIDFMMDNTSSTLLNVVNEVDRYITWPGQACAYKLGQREILGEPSGHFIAIDGLACLAVGKFALLGHVGGFRNLILVPRDQNAVFRQHQIRLNIIRTLFNRERVTRDGMFGPLTRCAAVGDDDGLAV